MNLGHASVLLNPEILVMLHESLLPGHHKPCRGFGPMGERDSIASWIRLNTFIETWLNLS